MYCTNEGEKRCGGDINQCNLLRKRGDEHAELPSADQWTAEESADSQKLGEEEEEETTLLRRIDVLVADRIERDLSR